MRRAALMILLLAAACGPSGSDLEAALERAAAENRPLVVDFWRDDCAPCLRMDDETWPDADVQKALEEWIFVKVDVKADPEAVDRYAVTAVPTLLLLSPEGERKALFRGFVSAEHLLAALQAYR